MATDQRYVDTDVAPGGDGTSGDPFAALSEWESTVGASNSATDDYIVDCAGIAADTTGVTVDFSTNISTGSITIRGNRSDSLGFYAGNQVISDQHYLLSQSASFFTLRLLENNVIVDGIQVEQGRGSVSAVGIGPERPTGIVRCCRVRASGISGIGIGNSGGVGVSSGGSITIENNLVVGFTNVQINHGVTSSFGRTVIIRHNTCYGTGSSSDGIVVFSGTGTCAFTLSANAVANNGSGVDIDASAIGGSTTVTYADNALEQSLGTTDEIALGSAASAWTSPGTSATSDFTVKDTSSPLYNAVNPTLVMTDITGYTRDGTNHDVGAFEFQGGGGGGGTFQRPVGPRFALAGPGGLAA